MQKIEIDNLGPISHVALEVDKYNVIIGEQATGKSTIAKGIYFFKQIKFITKNYLLNYYNEKAEGQTLSNWNKELRNQAKEMFIGLFGESWNMRQDMKMTYNFTNELYVTITVASNKHYLNVVFCKKLNDAIQNVIKQIDQNNKKYDAQKSNSLNFDIEERINRFNMINEMVNNIFEDYDDIYYIPAGRSMLATISNSKLTMAENGKNIDLITKRFLMLTDNVRLEFSDGLTGLYQKYESNIKNRVQIKKLITQVNKVFNGEYYCKDGKEYILIKSTDKAEAVPINFISSGQQELLWLVYFLLYLIVTNQRSFVIIEELEAHIYPKLQKEITELAIQFANMNGSQVLLTTHSPYVLNATSNLFYAGELRKEDSDKVMSIVEKDKIIDSNRFKAYKITKSKNSKSKIISIIDKERKEVKVSLIDEISNEFNMTYTSLYDIELDRIQEE